MTTSDGAVRHKRAIAMLAKVPHAGAVKTRLVPPLDEAQAAMLAAAFIRDLGGRLAELERACNATATVYYAPADGGNAMAILAPQLRMVAQIGTGLGQRLRAAVQDLEREGFEHIILIGSDSPTIPGALFSDAFAALDAGADVAVSRAEDGGYVLAALAGAHTGLFDGIPWSTDHVYARTIGRAHELGLRTTELRPWYDVDDEDGLERLRADLSEAGVAQLVPQTRKALTSL